MATQPQSVYVHIPFCRHRCGYCNFTVITGRDDLRTPVLDAIETEFQQLASPHPVDTLYIGGGTPTLLTADQLDRLCRLMRRWFPPNPGYEWSIEANPWELDEARLDALAGAGVNRISLGAQSFDSNKLRCLERDHTTRNIHRALELCRARFVAISLDLIFGAPGESLDTWRRDIETAIAACPEHISAYGLTYERGARFFGRLRRGDLTAIAEEEERAMYELAIDLLAAHGWEQYEVSNFARPGYRCRHNEAYWLGAEYFAAGPGAARYVNGCREVNHRSTTTYLKRVLTGMSPVAERERLSPEDRVRECLVFQLRMLDGVARAQFAAQTGYDLDQLIGPALHKFTQLGLLEDTGPRVRLTRSGLMISDTIWPELL